MSALQEQTNVQYHPRELTPSNQNIVGNFLMSPLAELQAAKAAHSLCSPCMKHAVMSYFDRASVDDVEFSRLAVARREAHAEKRSDEPR